MNIPSLLMLQGYLAWLGSTTTALGNGSIGLIAQPFSGSQSTTLVNQLTEANYNGYARQALGNPSTTFVGSDGNVYNEFNTLQFVPTGSSTPNTIYGVFFTPGNDSTKVWQTDALAAPFGMSSSLNRLTITPRCGLNPAGNFGLNVISS
jgi:hypothetical protein